MKYLLLSKVYNYLKADDEIPGLFSPSFPSLILKSFTTLCRLLPSLENFERWRSSKVLFSPFFFVKSIFISFIFYQYQSFNIPTIQF